MSSSSAKFLKELHQQFDLFFSREEIKSLAFEAGVDHENLKAQTRNEYIRELLLVMSRNGRLSDMIKIAQNSRPNVRWPNIPDEFEPPEAFSSYIDEQTESFNMKTLPQRGTWEPETVLVPGGPFIMGAKEVDDRHPYESPQFELALPAFRIGKYPVTNEQYSYYLQQCDLLPKPEFDWNDDGEPKTEQDEWPVLGVSWEEAVAYCEWLAAQTKRPYTLPSEAQWEKAARGTKGQPFPWGDEWEGGKHCNLDPNQTTSVKHFPKGASPFECLDMLGNGREWTTTHWGNKRRTPEPISQYPWKLNEENHWIPDKGMDKLRAHKQMRRVTRGGIGLYALVTEFAQDGYEMNIDDPENLRITRRTSELPFNAGLMKNRIGFRVVLNWED